MIFRQLLKAEAELGGPRHIEQLFSREVQVVNLLRVFLRALNQPVVVRRLNHDAAIALDKFVHLKSLL